MLALVNRQPPRLVRDHPSAPRAPGEARLRMRLSGICDTDLQLARGYMGFRGVLGHEVVAEVVECDDPGWLGQRVVGDINAGCGTCADCRDDRGHHCRKRSVLGILGRDGALAEELLLPERCLVAVPESVPDHWAVFAEPLAAALHVLDELPEDFAGPAVVLGDGKLGLLVVRALAGADLPVTLVGHHPDKLALGERFGARTVLEAELDREAARAPLVVECTGNAAGVELALALTEPHGTVVLKTTVAGKVELDLSAVVVNELVLAGSRCGDLQRAVGALAAGLDPTPLVAARYPLARAEEALAHAGKKGTLKVLVEGPHVTPPDGLSIRPGLVIPDAELSVRAVRSSGPGGQNVNRVATKVELVFDLPASTALDPSAKARLGRIAAGRLDSEGRVLVTSQATRSQSQNLADARDKLAALIRAALVVPKRRRKTKPTRASKERRLDAKRRQSQKKQARRTDG